ncbi:D123 family protein [Cryptosporidium andersoni]|uniref:D123 family protein n=1 Tax=Cryptosporidium andersoni TaxID=117008 RepID=A0A1J4MTB0_9CRYT|nr:D123 family protein [Cryptosporidium andersoni]
MPDSEKRYARLIIDLLLRYTFLFEIYLNKHIKVDEEYIPPFLNKIGASCVDILENSGLSEVNRRLPDIENQVILTLCEDIVIVVNIKVYLEFRVSFWYPIEAKSLLLVPNKVGTVRLVNEAVVDNKEAVSGREFYFKLIRLLADLGTPRDDLDINNFLIESILNFFMSIWGPNLDIYNGNDFGCMSWFPIVNSQKKMITIPSSLIPIPKCIINEYMNIDGIYNISKLNLSKESKIFLERLNLAVNKYSKSGCVPKFTWSTPTDSCWILPNSTIRCENYSDVMILLKASTKVSEDLERSQNQKDFKHAILLREYIPTWDSSMEFRIFLSKASQNASFRINGISQRHISLYFEELVSNKKLQNGILSSINSLVKYNERELINELFEVLETKKLAIDVYLIKTSTKYKFRSLIVDISLMYNIDTLLFSFSELKFNQLRQIDEELNLIDLYRVIEDPQSTIYQIKNDLKGKVPKEMLNMCDGNDIEELLSQFSLKLEGELK